MGGIAEAGQTFEMFHPTHPAVVYNFQGLRKFVALNIQCFVINNIFCRFFALVVYKSSRK